MEYATWTNEGVGRWRLANEKMTPMHLALYIKGNKKEREGIGSFSLGFLPRASRFSLGFLPLVP